MMFKVSLPSPLAKIMDQKKLSPFLHPRYWPTWLAVGVLRVLTYLPLPVVHTLGTMLGDVIHTLHKPRRHVALRNIERCFPELSTQAQRQLVRQQFREVAKSTLSIGLNWWANERRLNKIMRLKDEHHYKDALGANKNIILLAPHFVALEIGGIFLSAQTPVVSMYQNTKNNLIDELVRRGRARFGAVLVERRADMFGLVRHVRQGKPFYYLPDQDPGRRKGGIFAPFFNIQTATFPMLSRFARMTNAVVIPCATRQLPQGHGYEIIFFPPLQNFPTHDETKDTEAMNRMIEQMVRTMPEQYFWVHKRFKTRPEGEADFYT
jgi:KDO2-lipid IV(A) lauroyltransferase